MGTPHARGQPPTPACGDVWCFDCQFKGPAVDLPKLTHKWTCSIKFPAKKKEDTNDKANSSQSEGNGSTNPCIVQRSIVAIAISIRLIRLNKKKSTTPQTHVEMSFGNGFISMPIKDELCLKYTVL